MKNTEIISRSELEQIVECHQGNNVFKTILDRSSVEAVFRVVAQYVAFNSIFAAGVASLASAIGSRSDIFRDNQEPIIFMADKSYEIASYIFYAAIDEFGGNVLTNRITHRSLAQKLLRFIALYSRYDATNVTRITKPSDSTLAAIREVKEGYGINKEVQEQAIFYGVGFHLASEFLADKEFQILDATLRTRHKNLVDFLETNEAYDWIKIHTSVEADHFSAGLKSANLSLQYYCSGEVTEAKQRIMDGFKGFCKVQSIFLRTYSLDVMV